MSSGKLDSHVIDAGPAPSKSSDEPHAKRWRGNVTKHPMSSGGRVRWPWGAPLALPAKHLRLLPEGIWLAIYDVQDRELVYGTFHERTSALNQTRETRSSLDSFSLTQVT